MGVEIDKYDRIIACSSGVLTASMDVFWCGDISPISAHETGSEIVDKFVIEVAKRNNFEKEDADIVGSIRHLEREAPILADKVTDSFGGGSRHHIQDFSHHPTPVGLIFSILNEFTGYAYGTDNDGNFIPVEINNPGEHSFFESVYIATVQWGLHLISDVAGSSGTRKKNNSVGTGLPGPLLSTLKELSSIPGLKSIFGKDDVGKYVFSESCIKLFRGDFFESIDVKGRVIKESSVQFDLRTELGLAHEMISNKQHIPILLSELIVCAFYSIRRLLNELKEQAVSSLEELRELDFSKFLPWNSNELKRMRTLSALSFSTIDMSMAAFESFVKCSGDKTRFAIGFLERINYFGAARLIVAGGGELGIKCDELYDEYKPVFERLSNQFSEVTKDVKGVTVVTSIAGMGTPLGFVSASIGVYKIIKSSADEYNLAKEERERIQEECESNVLLLQEYRTEMEEIVSEYMIDRLTVFGAGLDMMDQALLSDNTDDFIKGNNMIQEKLGNDASFSSQDEFDALMNSNDDFKF